jgi:hypothetical protein
MPLTSVGYAEGAMLTIDYVTSRESDEPIERIGYGGRTVVGARLLAEQVLLERGGTICAAGAPVIGYLIRDDAGTVVSRLYKGLG